MQRDPTPASRDLVLVGGGHSHVTVLRRFGMEPLPGVRVTLISRDTHAPYSGMLPGLIAGHYTFDEAHIDLAPLARFAGARFLHDEVVGLDQGARRVLCRNRPPVAFDVLSIDIGSSPRTHDVEGAAELVVPVKPIDGFARKWQRIQQRLLRRDEPAVMTMVGGGAGGVELLLAVQHRLGAELERRGRPRDLVRFELVTGAGDVLPTHNARVRAKFRRVLGARGITVYNGQRVERVERAGRTLLHLDSGACLEADEVLWVTTAAAQEWPGAGGLATDAGGFIEVLDTLQTPGDPDIFAAGDIAAVRGRPRPKAGVFAVRQGPPLAANLRRRLRGEPTHGFRPQRRFLSLVSTGDRYAVASRSFWSVEGRWVWRWKDRIDRAFMRQYNELPAMEQESEHPTARLDAHSLEVPRDASMRCGGCGAKVGSGVLERVLARIEPVQRDDVLVGLGDADDAAVIDVPADRVLVQTVDHFPAFIDDPWVFGQVTANHALGDIYAMGAEPQTAMAVVTVPYAGEQQMEQEVFHLLAGAQEVFREAGTALVGGHTGEGDSMALGFAVSGLAARDALTSKAGLQPGDALVLTKPLGTGTLFAAQMRGRAKGRWIEAALRSMLRSQRDAAACLRRYGVHAMTDITGFGLLGHLLEMVRASRGVGVEIDLDAVPVLPGALQSVAAGIHSSLAPQNRRHEDSIDNPEATGHPGYPLLFDPQTAGGLLAAVPAERAAACIAELQALDYPAAGRIGGVEASPAARVVLA